MLILFSDDILITVLYISAILDCSAEDMGVLELWEPKDERLRPPNDRLREDAPLLQLVTLRQSSSSSLSWTGNKFPLLSEIRRFFSLPSGTLMVDSSAKQTIACESRWK